jgi:hypothetical protein
MSYSKYQKFGDQKGRRTMHGCSQRAMVAARARAAGGGRAGGCIGFSIHPIQRTNGSKQALNQKKSELFIVSILHNHKFSPE